MSWDIFIYDFPKDAKTPADIPSDWKPPTIGSPAEIITKIKTAIPSADFSNPHWGVIEGKGYSIEVSLGTNQTLTSITLYARGGESAVEDVSAIVSRLGLRAIDSGTGEFFEPGPKAAEGYRHWAEYRNQVASKQGASNKTLEPTAAVPYVLATVAILAIVAALWRHRRRLRLS